MVRKAKIEDVKTIHALLAGVGKGVVIPRSLSELYEHIREFFVYEADGKVCGAAALHIVWEDLAEIRSVAINDQHKGKGAGKALINECLAEARQLGVSRLFVLTYIPEYFQKFGFGEVDKSALPHKVWSDCVKCVKFPDCDEIAMLKRME